MKDPILHITESNLAKVLEKLFNNKIVEVDSQAFAREILIASKPHQLKSLYIIKTTGTLRKKLEKTVDAESQYVEKFNGMLSSLRLLANHRVAKPIRKEDKDYILLKEITKLALEFSQDFEIEFIEDAFKHFIQTGLDLMGKKYGLNKFKFYKQKIYDRYEALEIINNDNAPKLSQLFYREWRNVLKKYANALIDIESEEDFAHIVLARTEADEYKANYTQWITAQFEELAFLDAIPSMTQLYGINALKRYQKHTTTRKAQSNVEAGEQIIETSPEMAEYFRRIRERRAE